MEFHLDSGTKISKLDIDTGTKCQKKARKHIIHSKITEYKNKELFQMDEIAL